ncbi:hypothetical protein MMPV_005942 [Pyropia vietnamensis]
MAAKHAAAVVTLVLALLVGTAAAQPPATTVWNVITAINCGGQAVPAATSSDGIDYVADAYFSPSSRAWSRPVALPEQHRTLRYAESGPLYYTVPVPGPGYYRVNLTWTELYQEGPNERGLIVGVGGDVIVEPSHWSAGLVMDNTTVLDIWSLAGGNTMDAVSFVFPASQTGMTEIWANNTLSVVIFHVPNSRTSLPMLGTLQLLGTAPPPTQSPAPTAPAGPTAHGHTVPDAFFFGICGTHDGVNPDTFNDADHGTHDDALYDTHDDALYDTHDDALYGTHDDALYDTHDDALYGTHDDALYDTHDDALYGTHDDALYDTHDDALCNADYIMDSGAHDGAYAHAIASADGAAHRDPPVHEHPCRAANSLSSVPISSSSSSAAVNSTIRAATVKQCPVMGMEDLRVSYYHVLLQSGTHHVPHQHPRAAEGLIVTTGTVDVFFVEECGAVASGSTSRLLRNTVSAGGVAVFPLGLLHGVSCVSTSPCTYLSTHPHADPGVVLTGATICAGPIADVAAMLGVPHEDAAVVCAGMAPQLATSQPTT